MVEFTVFKGSKSGRIVESKTTKDIGPHDVLLKVTHSGLCFTDVHFKHSDTVLGHEGVGVVMQTGSEVTLFEKGDRAGWGYNHSSCLHCAHCLRGMDTFCAKRAVYGVADLDQGSMATHAIWNENFLQPIPASLDSADAAPLMCGGATVFNALYLHGVKAGDRVGVIGVGGLGHLAIQYGSKMGCTVAVFSGSDSKKDEAMRLGASEFFAVKDVKSGEEMLELVKRPFDVLLVTASAQPDWKLYLPVIANGGMIVPLSVSDEDLVFPYMPIVVKALRIQGSLVADRLTARKMLEFSAEHGVKPIVQTFKLGREGIEEAFGVLEGGSMRYRGVLVAEE